MSLFVIFGAKIDTKSISAMLTIFGAKNQIVEMKRKFYFGAKIGTFIFENLLNERNFPWSEIQTVATEVIVM